MNNNLKYILIISLLIFLNIFILFKWYDSNKLNKKFNNEITLVQDSIRYFKDKNNEYLTQNNAYILEVNDLKKINKELSNEIKYLKENPLIVEKIETVTNIDTVEMENKIYKKFNCGVYTFTNNFLFDETFDTNNSININGTSVIDIDTSFNIKSSSSYLNNMSLKTELILSFTEQKGEIHINAKSKNPMVNITRLNGYILNKETYKTIKNFQKPKRFYFGVGLNYQYNFKTSKFDPGVGVSLGLKIFEF